MKRHDGRTDDALRPMEIVPGFLNNPPGSALVTMGGTRVLCAASVEESVPIFLRDQGEGWVTGEYAMLPASTNRRSQREIVRGRPSGRTMEIQRLIGRSLRMMVDLAEIGERTLRVDCDVLNADGGTRTASITGAFVALADAIRYMQDNKLIKDDPIIGHVASVSVGIYNGTPIMDLDYVEDSNCETDMNIVMNDQGGYIEVQGTAEGTAFSPQEFQAMLDLGKLAIDQLIEHQREALAVG